MKKLIILSLTTFLISSAYANRGRGLKVTESSKIIDFIKRVEDVKREGNVKAKYPPKIHDFLHRKTIKMGIEISDLKSYVVKNSNDPKVYEAIKELFELSFNDKLTSERRETIEKLFGLTAKIDQLPVNELKITTEQVLEASKEWSTNELVELEKLLSEVLTQRSSREKTAGEILLENLDPILRTQAQRKCM